MFPPIPPRTTDSELAFPSFKRVLVILWRALRLRCPNCGKGKVLRGWWHVRESCPVCGFVFDRGDEHYFAGAMFSSIIIAELLFAVGFTAVLLATWPNVPWETVTYVGGALMLLLPVLLHPFARVLWLAIDTMVRPVTPDELRAPTTPTRS